MENNFNYRTRQLISLAREGDETAKEQLFQAYGERVLWIVRLRMGKELRTKLESMDLVQEAFISALRGLEDFTYCNEGDFLRWISSIAENRIRDNVDKLHALKRDNRREIPLDIRRPSTQRSFAANMGPITTTTPSRVVSKREQLDRLEWALDQVKPEYREAVVLTKIEGLSYREAGDRLGKSPDAMRMLLSRAMTALTAVLGKPDGEVSSTEPR
ncbi:MAG: sigma-70 family RNA polymerase sigma factor [Phycisphaerales bacterium]|nr:MAG: sigma-70 family RNA polymerase sigma factor [Phycisphaerales bacterium]